MAITTAPKGPKVQRMKVLRPFYLNGEVQDVGAVVTIDNRTLAADLLGAGKAEPVADEPAKGAKA